jgi:hypothetical protein
MFTLEQQIFSVSSAMEKGWFYSTPRVFQEFQQKFPDFQSTQPTTCPESLQMRKHVFGNR